jgi:hypothetical protein
LRLRTRGGIYCKRGADSKPYERNLTATKFTKKFCPTRDVLNPALNRGIATKGTPGVSGRSEVKAKNCKALVGEKIG